MRKLFTLLTLLVCLCTGAWGATTRTLIAEVSLTSNSTFNTAGTFMGSGAVNGMQNSSSPYKIGSNSAYVAITLNNGYYFRPGDEVEIDCSKAAQLFVGTTGSGGSSSATVLVTTGSPSDGKVTCTLPNTLPNKTKSISVGRTSSSYNGTMTYIKVYRNINSDAYTVTFNAGSNGTCATASLTEVSASAGVELPAVTPNSGYSFNGWYTDASEGTKVGDAGNIYYPTDNVTIYAQYVGQTAPTIDIDEATFSTPRGVEVTFTANTTGAPAPTVTWYQSESATTSGGVEKGTGTTYDPDVTTPGTYYYYAIAANGVSPDATSELITLTVTNPDVDRTGYNTYYVAETETAVNGKKILCDDITMTFVNTTGAFNAATADNNVNSVNSNFVASISGDNSSSGWGVTFTPTSNGTLSVGVIINEGRTFTITNATSFTYNGTSVGSNESNTWTPAAKQYTIVTFNVTSGTTYTLSVAGSKMGFYGFEFVKEAPAPTTTETTVESATFTGSSTVTATSAHISATGNIKSGSTVQGLSTGMKLESGTGTITITLPAGAKNASVVLLADGSASKLYVDNNSTTVSSTSITGGGYNITVSLPDNTTTNDATHTIAKDSNPSIYKISLSYEIDLDKAYLTTSANMAGWRAFYDANNGYTLDNNTTAYVATASGDGKVTLTPLAGGVPSGTAVILHTSSSAESFKMTLTKANVNAYNGANLLTWTTGAVSDKYRLGYNSTDGVGFYPYSGTPASGAVILNVSSASQTPAKALTLAFSDVTGISGVSAKKAVSTGKRYNLSGQLVGEDYKGIVIENGKKYIK